MRLKPDHAWLERLRGRFLVFEGPDGSGKSTQITKLERLATSRGVPVCHVREPGGTPIGEQVRQVLLDPDNHGMDTRCEMLLYMASRAQLVAQRIGPALACGELVLADRFISSTLAYQGAAGGLGSPDILTVARIAVGRAWPDLVVVFDVDEKTAAQRLNPLMDRMERKGASFHQRVRQGYLAQADADPDHYLLIDATPDEQTVWSRLLEGLRDRTQRQDEPDGGSSCG